MIKVMKNIVLVVLLLSYGISFSQENQEKAPKNSKKFLVSGIKTSELFEVKNVSWWRRYSPKGHGEFLDFVFDINNNHDKLLNLRVFIIAFNELDNVDIEYRKKFPYPSWRTRDFDKEVIGIQIFNSIPQIDDNRVENWLKSIRSEKYSPLYRKKSFKWNDKNHHRFLEYISYASQHPEEGLKVKLQGLKNGVYQKTSAKNYEILLSPLKTTIRGNFYSKFLIKKKFYNHLGIIIYDEERKEVAYRKFFRFDKLSKIR